MKDQIFVSYSRDQLYYAESVVHTLQKQNSNFNIWFDLQQLGPGTVWVNEIESGLRDASRIILVASRSSLQSPYVAIEWMHALENRKPIYIVLFEEVEFKSFTTEFKGKTMVVPLEYLRVKAKAIIDGRGNFKKSIERLSESLAGTARHKDTIPSRNRLKIPLRLPLPVAFIAGTMVALTMLALVLTFTLLSAFIPMMVVGFIATAYCGLQTWEFLQRKSYQGTRMVLAIAPVIAYLFAVWFTPIALLALYFAIYSEDVHRWSPRGEGNNPRDLILKRKKPLWQQILPFLILVPLLLWQPGLLWLILIIWFFVRNRNSYETHRRGDMVVGLLILSTLLILIDPIIALPIVLVLAAIANRRQKPIAGTGSRVNVTYLVHAQAEDANIVEDIDNAMEYVGLKSPHLYQKVVNPDYQIVVISNFGDPPEIETLKSKGGKIVVVVASSLTDWERAKAYSDYQWVDYRKQDPERLIAMARDLKAGKESNSFNIRIVPQSFERLVVPARVFLFTLVQLFFYSATIFRLTRGIAIGTDFNLVLLIFSMISLGVSFWIVGNILDRRITVVTMTKINLGMSFALNMLILIIDLVKPLPPGYERDTKLILVFLFVNVISVFIFYRVGIFQIETIMKWWLPQSLRAGKNQPNKELSRVALLSGLVTILFTISFFGKDIPVSHDKLPPNQVTYEQVKLASDLSLDVPVHWLDIPKGIQDDGITPYILNVPLSAVLVKANGPSNKDLALTINSYFQSPFATETLTLALFDLLGGRIENVFQKIVFSISPGSVPWHPEDYGSPIFTTTCVPGGKIEDTLIMTVWLYRMNTPFVVSVDTVVANARIAPNTQPVQPNILAPNITGFNSEATAIKFKENPEKTVVVLSLDTSGSDYYVTISGSDQVLEENKLVLEHILESLNPQNLTSQSSQQ
jgi:hypothetical protein